MNAANITSKLTSKLNAILVAGAVAAVIPGAASASTLTLTNQSNIRIDHVYVSLSKSSNWGPDRLGRDVLVNGYHTDVPLPEGWYDVKLVDSDGDHCEIDNVQLNQDTGLNWALTDAYLLNCESRSGGN
jgi:hypothetical protein